ncbi:TetR/AcrR family transcriptional regulator [Actinotalea sp. K2]|uniref:TetR/AcrR family transcriptional regulator n=1 Tax=Actinotalea sp. K2 TaxID=2939438 RepID=UPI002017E49D|nr:TetR/AcrR family transcriptional regulator [Actinotalea sp. K2]MCL3860198.1 TetR/AcrR family transcriptional regulator [Actinotalea sp. K2]
MPPTSRRTSLTPEDWSEAGLLAMAEGGLGAVRVEPLAQRLGATKGSFYWHFADRAALVDAVLERWEAVATEQVIADLEAEADPRRRLRSLFALTFADPTPGAQDLAVLAAAAHPQVALVLERVTRRRVDYMAAVLAEVGVAGHACRARALQAYVLWIGLLQMTSAVPQVVPGETPRAKLLEAVLEGLERLLDP